MTNEQLLYLVIVLIVTTAFTVLAYLLFLSTPPEKQAERQERRRQFEAGVESAIEVGEKLSNETDFTEADDIAVEAFKQIWKLYKSGKLEQFLTPTTTEAPVAPEDVYDPAKADRA